MYKFMLFMSLFSAQLVWAGETVYVARLTGQGVSESEIGATTDLIGSAVTETKGYKLTENPSGATFVIKGKLVRLGQSLVLTLGKYQGDSLQGETKKMKAVSMDDMDTVTTRLVRAVLEGQTVEESQKVTEVTQDEEHAGTRRFQGLRQTVLGYGQGGSSELNASGSGHSFYAGRSMGLDHDVDLLFELQTYFAKATAKANFNFIDIGLNYYLNRNKHAPYVSGKFGYGEASADDDKKSVLSNDTAWGFILGAGVGYKFWRTSSVNLAVGLDYNYMLTKLNQSDKNPSTYTLRLLVYF